MAKENVALGGGFPARVVLVVSLALVLLAGSFTRAEERKVPLSSVSTETRAPRIAAGPNGDCTVIWLERSDDGASWRLAARRRLGGEWKPIESPGDSVSNIGVTEAVVALDSDSNPHALWVSRGEDGDALYYGFRERGGWSRGIAIAESEQNEIRNIDLDILGGPSGQGPSEDIFMSWLESRGTSNRIRTLMMDPEGDAHEENPLGSDAPRYVVFPELLPLPASAPDKPSRMALTWFDLESPQVRIEMRGWDFETGVWKEMETPPWPAQCVETLPLLGATSSAGSILVGYRDFGLSDRVFICSDPFFTLLADDAPLSQNRYPRISSPFNGLVGLVWEQDSGEAGLQLARAVVEPRAGQCAILPSTPIDSFLPAEPDVALANGGLLTVWTAMALRPPEVPWEPQSVDQTPRIFFSETPTNHLAFQPMKPIEDIPR